MVNFLTVFSEDMVEPLLVLLKPNIYAQRPNRSIKGEPSFGGQVITVKEGADHTADMLIQEILRKYGPLPAKP